MVVVRLVQVIVFLSFLHLVISQGNTRDADAVRSFLKNPTFRGSIQNVSNGSMCAICNIAVSMILAQIKLGFSSDVVQQEAEFACILLRIETRRVCKKLIELNKDTLLYIVQNNPNLTGEKVCGIVYQSSGCAKNNEFDWSIKIPDGKPPPRRISYKDNGSFKILHLTDIHYDPNYTPGANSDCGEPICCQPDQGKPNSPDKVCGYWSDYNYSDVPWHLFVQIMNHLKSQKFDYVYFTGDIVDHRYWETSVELNSKKIIKVLDYFREQFNVPVFNVLGNHETHPLNLWPPEKVKDKKFSINWLLKLIANPWSSLARENIVDTILKGGYYTVSPKPGFRIIVLNSNVCYIYNFWLLFDNFDPYNQLQWLVDTLKKAEDNNEIVHILSHVTSGDPECFLVWAREYSRIVKRFANTIVGQFSGHTHQDQFHIYYDGVKPVNVAFDGAAATPYSNANPSYKIFEVDAATFSLRNYEEWTFNLTAANLYPNEPLAWYKLYSFTDAYGVENLEPEDVAKAAQKMATNHSLLYDYYRYRFRNGDAALKEGCNEQCLRNNLCQMVTSYYGDTLNCYAIQDLYEKSKN